MLNYKAVKKQVNSFAVHVWYKCSCSMV